jgi:hypothetical protein
MSLYADDMALTATFRRPLLLFRYLETYLSRLEHWLQDYRVGINVSKSNAVFFGKTVRCIQMHRPVKFFEESIQWVTTVSWSDFRYIAGLEGTCQEGGSSKIGHALPLLNRRSDLFIRNGVLLYKQPSYDWLCLHAKS